ncbi:MAG: hypothetical protein DRP83_00155 [Planctomycetota bacterium]|nr:MAG: hypothetical protein DRP83_00155 [Planctomycetota bacterium]
MTEAKNPKIPLARLLLRRKELNALFQARFDALRLELTKDDLQRRKVNEETDQVEGVISLVDKAGLEKEADYYAHQRRLADSVVQQANWATDVEVPAHVMTDDDVTETNDKAKAKLAELLVRRRDLEQRMSAFGPSLRFRTDDLHEQVSDRLPIADGLAKITEKVERKTPSQLKPFMQHDALQAKLRAVDTVIQKANWDTVVEVPVTVLSNFSA